MSSEIRKEEVEKKEDETEKREEKRVRWCLRVHDGELVAGENMMTTISIGFYVKEEKFTFV